MIHKCIRSQYSLKGPHPKKETKKKTELRGHGQASCSLQEATARLGEGGADHGPASSARSHTRGWVQSRFSHQLSGVRK